MRPPAIADTDGLIPVARDLPSELLSLLGSPPANMHVRRMVAAAGGCRSSVCSGPRRTSWSGHALISRGMQMSWYRPLPSTPTRAFIENAGAARGGLSENAALKEQVQQGWIVAFVMAV